MAQAAKKLDPTTMWGTRSLMAWKPRERLTPSQWTEKKRWLGDSAEEKGPLRLRRTPYAKFILDMAIDPDIDKVVFMKPAQIAGTEIVISICGYFADQIPSPIMLCMADEKTADYVMTERVQKMFTDSPDLKHLVDPKAFSIDRIKLINGAYISMAWASSVSRLATRPTRVFIGDEIDKPGYYVKTKEASPISLGSERTETFFNKLVFLLSTPTIEEGNINQELNACDVIYDFHVACHKCGQRQPLRWSRKYADGFKGGLYRDEHGKRRRLGQIVWQGGRKATLRQIEKAGYQCGNCKAAWNTVQKNIAVEDGLWVPRTKISFKPRDVGVHINRIYSLLGRSGDIPALVRKWIDAQKGDLGKLQGFVNSTLAEVWRVVIVATDEGKLLKARIKDLKPQAVPAEAIALTCGIDQQLYGFWFVVRAWARDYTSWLIHYGQIATWDEVEALLFTTRYPVAEKPGESKGIWRAAIDTGGTTAEDDDISMTEKAYWWIRKNGRGRGCMVHGTKGASRPLEGKMKIGKALDRMPSSNKPIPGGLQIVSIDTEKMKDTYHFRLGSAVNGGGDENPQAAFLHSKVGNDYAKQIMAEEKRLDEKGLKKWVQVRPDNHLLDAEVNAMAAAEPEFPGGGVHILRPPQKKSDETPARSGGWVKGGRSGGGGSNWIGRK